VAGRPIEDAHKFGWLTFKDVIAHSSNIGMIKVGQRVGKAGLYHYVRDFGFGSRTGVDLAGEVEGIAHHPATWSKRSLATIAMGQEVSVTPLQLANAYCAIANKGRLMRPYAVSQVVDKQGQVLEETKPLCIRRVVSDSTAHTITRMLTAVVEEGTGIKAQIEGIAVAGKTGTAQKPRLDGRGYAPGEFVASFVGFLPADDPKLLCLVIVDTPRGLYWGSEAAAPAFKRMVDRILSLDSNPIRRRERVVLVDRNPKEDDLLIVPDLRGYLVFDAKRLLAGYHLTPATRGSGNRVREQSIAPGEWVKPATRIQLATQESPRDSVQATGLVPDVSGLSLRKAVAVLAESGLDVRIRGSGIVRNQQPAKGTSVHAGTLCVIEGDCSDAAGAGPMRLSSLLE
jgi:membrane peptidoglycan carboxypeptidase